MQDVAQRCRRLGKLDEWFRAIRVTPHAQYVVERTDQGYGDGRKNSARYRQQVRCENQLRRRAPRLERRAHFFEVAVTIADAVGSEVIRNFGEEQFSFRRVSRARHTTRRVSNDRRAVGDQLMLNERRKREQDRSWITTRIRDHICVADDLTIELGEAIGYAFASIARSQIGR